MGTRWLLGVLSLGFAQFAAAHSWPEMSGVSVSHGIGRDSMSAYRAGLQWYWGPIWCEDCLWRLEGYTEASIAFINADKGPVPTSNDSMEIFAVSPVLRLVSDKRYGMMRPYGEFGIGISYLSETEFSGRYLGMHGQFEDRIGFGTTFGKRDRWDLNIQFKHHSNGSIAADNDGINVYYLTLGYWYD